MQVAATAAAQSDQLDGDVWMYYRNMRVRIAHVILGVNRSSENDI